MSYQCPVMPKLVPPRDEENEQSLPPKARINPEHLLQAIQNSLEHSGDTAHGITGLTFKNYSVTVHKRKGFCWVIECKFKRMERDS